MVKFSQRQKHIQKHKFSHKLTPNIRTIQELTLLHQQQIEQRIAHELSQNYALELEKEPDFLEQMEPKENDDDWNEDYGKPIDEYETGDPPTSQETEPLGFFDISADLELAATQRFIDHPDQLAQAMQCVDYYRIHGYLPEGADLQLHEDLAVLQKSASYQIFPSIHSTFEIVVEADRVEANVSPMGLNLRYVRGLGSFSTKARNFIQALNDRNRLLNELAYYILETLQGDFFRQQDLDTALRFLLPVSIKELCTLPINMPFKLDKKYLSKLGDHLVACPFGTFPLNFFLQQKAQLLRLLVNFAIRDGMVTPKEQLEWIGDQIKKRVENWEINDIRYKFISPLKSATINDIKYARRIYRQSLTAK
jgi:hypothetical protein